MATQLPNQGQWWSNFSTQLLQSAQWLDLKGLIIPQVPQFLIFLYMPRWTILNFFKKKKSEIVWFLFDLSITFLGSIPGSESVVINIRINTIINNTADTIGTAIEILSESHFDYRTIL